jgi:hypothetical protein
MMIIDGMDEKPVVSSPDRPCQLAGATQFARLKKLPAEVVSTLEPISASAELGGTECANCPAMATP